MKHSLEDVNDLEEQSEVQQKPKEGRNMIMFLSQEKLLAKKAEE